MAQLDQATRDSIIQQAQQRAQQNGTDASAELWKYAQTQGLTAAQIDEKMGLSSGTSNSWAQKNIPNYQSNSAIKPVQSNGLAQIGATAAPAATPTAATPTAGAAPTSRPYVGDANRDSIIQQAKDLATKNGTSAEQELYQYGTKNGYDNAGIDSAMGFGSGATQKWLDSQKPPSPPSGYNPQQNPYLGQMGRDIGSQMFDNWSRNQMPSIRSGAMAAGGFGGSRQGVVEANGFNDMNRQYGQALTSMYGNDWGNQQNRNVQSQSNQNQYNLGLGQLSNQAQSSSNNYDLGLRSSDLGFAGLDANIAQNNFGNKLSSANFGLNAYNSLGNQNNAATNAATTTQNQPMNYFNSTSNNTNSMANGYGTQTSSQTNPKSSNPFMGALGGAQLGNQMYKSWNSDNSGTQYT